MSLPRRIFGYAFILVMILALLVITMPVVACEEPTPTPTPTPPPPQIHPPQPAPNPSWYDCNWQFRKAVTIDKAKVAGSLSSFPVLVSLASDPDLSAHARSNGYDILFTSSDGNTRLSHEIESYTSSTGKLVAWVKVPALSSAEYTTLYLYYGFAASADQQDRNNVWNSNYRAVWHLKEDPSGASPQIKDSTSKGLHGSSRGTMTTGDQVAGKAGGSLDFDGKNDQVIVPYKANLDITGPITIEAWVKTPGNGNVVSKISPSTYQGYIMAVGGNAGNNKNGYYTDNAGWVYSKSNVNDNSWHHLVVVHSGTTASFYRDGVPDGSSATGSRTGNPAVDLWIGYRDNSGCTGIYSGILDEVRVSATARSAQWIRTEYNNQNSPSTFHYLSAEEKAGGVEACILPVPPQPDPGICTIGVDATSSGGADDTQSVTIPHTTSGTDRLMLVGVSINDDEYETVSSITYGGSALTRVGAIDNSRSGGDDARVEIWQLLAPETGMHDVVIRFSAPLEEQAVVGVMTFTGVDQGSPLGTFASSENDPSPAKVTVSSAPYDLVFGVVASEYGAITTGWGQAERWNLRPDSDETYGAGSTRAGASSVVLQWTLTSSPHWAAGGVSVRPCIIPPPPPPAPFTCPDTSRSLVTADGETVGCVAVSNDDMNLYVGFTSPPSDPLKTGNWAWGFLTGDIPQADGVPDPAKFPHNHLFPMGETSRDFPGVDISHVVASDVAYLTLSAHAVTQSGKDAWVISDTLVDGTGAKAKYFTHIIQA